MARAQKARDADRACRLRKKLGKGKTQLTLDEKRWLRDYEGKTIANAIRKPEVLVGADEQSAIGADEQDEQSHGSAPVAGAGSPNEAVSPTGEGTSPIGEPATGADVPPPLVVAAAEVAPAAIAPEQSREESIAEAKVIAAVYMDWLRKSQKRVEELGGHPMPEIFINYVDKKSTKVAERIAPAWLAHPVAEAAIVLGPGVITVLQLNRVEKKGDERADDRQPQERKQEEARKPEQKQAQPDGVSQAALSAVLGE
jgi:hypothetical protein